MFLNALCSKIAYPFNAPYYYYYYYCKCRVSFKGLFKSEVSLEDCGRLFETEKSKGKEFKGFGFKSLELVNPH